MRYLKILLVLAGLLILWACGAVRIIGPNCVTVKHIDPVTLVEVDSLTCVTP